MNDQNKQLATINQTLQENESKLADALAGSGITVQRFRTVLLNSIRKNPDLLKCSISSLWEAMDAAAVAGIEIGGPNPLAYLVPYKTNCQLIISYRGLMELARRSGKVKNIAFGVVHAGDKFIPPSDPLEPQLVHQQSTAPNRKSKPITHVWCGYLMTNGARVFDIMAAEDIEAHKKQYAKGYANSDSAWATAWDTMALKTVLKRPINRGLVPISQRAEHLIELDNDMADAGIPEGVAEAATVEAKVIESSHESNGGVTTEHPDQTEPKAKPKATKAKGTKAKAKPKAPKPKPKEADPDAEPIWMDAFYVVFDLDPVNAVCNRLTEKFPDEADAINEASVNRIELIAMAGKGVDRWGEIADVFARVQNPGMVEALESIITDCGNISDEDRVEKLEPIVEKAIERLTK